MELLRSSILGKEFIGYRRTTFKDARLRFSKKVRDEGLGKVPIVVETTDDRLMSIVVTGKRDEKRSGIEMVFHMDNRIGDVLREIKIMLIRGGFEELVMDGLVKIGIENGDILSEEQIIGDIYKKYRNEDDKILYLLISTETTVYGYIMSIIRAIGRLFKKP